jgi:hypothetical protein
MQARLRLQRILKSAKQLGACRLGAIDGTAVQGAAVMLWKGDANGDSLVQFSELALLEHQMSAQSKDCTIVYYEVVYPSSWTSGQKQSADSPELAGDAIYEDAGIDLFKNLTYVQSTVLTRNVVGAEFRRYDGGGVTRPSFDYLLNFQFGNNTETEYGTVTVRTPATLPASQDAI